MYLAGLRSLRSLGATDWNDIWSTDPRVRFYRSGNWTGVDPAGCEARGGIVGFSSDPPPSQWSAYGYVQKAYFTCSYPPAPPAAPVTVAPPITTTVQTQVSPQVSPVFVQQENPSNSPVGAATSQTAPFTPTAAPDNSAFEAYLKELDARAAQRDAEMQDLLDRLNASDAGQTAPPPVLAPAMISDPVPVPLDNGSGIAPAAPDNALRNGIIIAAASAAFITIAARMRKGR